MYKFAGVMASVSMAAALAFGGTAVGQEYPDRPITIVVPYVAGGPADILARRLADPLSKELGVPVVIDNRGGAGGNLGMQVVAEAPADGYTILLTVNAQLAINPHLFTNLSWDPIEDFEPISYLSRTSYVLYKNPDAPIDSLADLIAMEKADPGSLSYASSGVGSGPHLAGAMLNTAAGISMEHIPYQGGAAVYPDLLAGRVPLFFGTLVWLNDVKEGRLDVLAVASEQEMPLLPGVPVIADTLPGFEASVWYAALAPKGTPEDIITKLNEGFIAALNDPGVVESLEAEGMEIVASSPDELAAHLASELDRWGPIVEASGASVN